MNKSQHARATKSEKDSTWYWDRVSRWSWASMKILTSSNTDIEFTSQIKFAHTALLQFWKQTKKKKNKKCTFLQVVETRNITKAKESGSGIPKEQKLVSLYSFWSLGIGMYWDHWRCCCVQECFRGDGTASCCSEVRLFDCCVQHEPVKTRPPSVTCEATKILYCTLFRFQVFFFIFAFQCNWPNWSDRRFAMFPVLRCLISTSSTHYSNWSSAVKCDLSFGTSNNFIPAPRILMCFAKTPGKRQKKHWHVATSTLLMSKMGVIPKVKTGTLTLTVERGKNPGPSL